MVGGLGPGKARLARTRSLFGTALFRNSFFLLATSALGYGFGFAFWLIVARSYPAETVGLSATLLSAILFLSTVATLGLPLGMIRFLPGQRNMVGLVNAALTITAAVSLVLGIAFLAGLDLWAPALVFVRIDAVTSAALIVSLIAFVASWVVDAAFVAVRRADYGMIRNGVFNAVRLPIPLAAAAALGLFGIVLSWTVAAVISLALAVAVLLPRLFPGYRLRLEIGPIREGDVLGYSLWNQAAVIAGGAAIALLPIAVLNAPEPRGGPTAAAHFYAAYTTASLLYVVPASVSMSLFAEGSHPGTSYEVEARRATWFSASLLVLGILTTVLLGRWILGIFGPSYAEQSYETLILLALASPIILANAIFTTYLRVAKRIRPLASIRAVSSSVTLVLASLFLPGLGIWGAGAAFVAGEFLAVPMFVFERWSNAGRKSVA